MKLARACNSKVIYNPLYGRKNEDYFRSIWPKDDIEHSVYVFSRKLKLKFIILRLVFSGSKKWLDTFWIMFFVYPQRLSDFLIKEPVILNSKHYSIKESNDTCLFLKHVWVFHKYLRIKIRKRNVAKYLNSLSLEDFNEYRKFCVNKDNKGTIRTEKEINKIFNKINNSFFKDKKNCNFCNNYNASFE